MKKSNLIFLSIAALLLFACRNATSNHAQKVDEDGTGERNTTAVKTVAFEPRVLLKDFDTWYRYTYYNVRLAQDFVPLDVDSTTISKTVFLNRLQTGHFVAFKITTQNAQPVFKLFLLPPEQKDIRDAMVQMAATEAEHLAMEGKELPAFNFKDLQGNPYTKANTKGKTMVLKCWFINCFACVQEFPQLNRLVASYQNQKDVLFLSLASDSKAALNSFLLKRPFSYAVVPNAGSYMNNALKISAYPTHLLVDKAGKIVKVTNSIEDMEPFIKKQAESSNR